MNRPRSLFALSALALAAIIMLPLFVGCENNETPPAVDVTGRWTMQRKLATATTMTTLTETLALTQSGDQLSGRVNSDAIAGTVQGYQIEFSGVVDHINMIFEGTVSKDGRSMAGAWKQTPNMTGNSWVAELH